MDSIEFEIRSADNDRRLKTILPHLEEMFGDEMAKLYEERENWAAGRLLMVGAVWGEKFLSRFDAYCLSTILTKTNLEALRGRATILIYTDHASHAKLVSRMKSLNEVYGIEFEARLIHPAVMSMWADHWINKLWIIGIAHQAGVHIAARRGMDFHMLLPDHLQGKYYYPNIFRLSKKWEGIAQNGISADLMTAGPDIETYRDADGFLAIPDRSLGALALRHMHGQSQSARVGNEHPLPTSHHMLWTGHDRLYHFCMRMNAAYLSNRACRAAPTRIPATLDAAIPFFMPKQFYVPTADDDLGFIELSDDDKYIGPTRLDSWQKFIACCWSSMNFDEAYLPFCRPLGETPIPTQETGYLETEEICRRHADVINGLIEAYPEACKGFAKAASMGMP